MRRFLPALYIVLSAVLPQLYAANSTIYTLSPNQIITTLSTKTLHEQDGFIPVSSGLTAPVLSSDGNTFYLAGAETALFPKGQLMAVDRLTGKMLHTYRTNYPIWDPAPLAVAPNQSQIYIATCSLSVDGVACQGGNVEVFDVASGLNLAAIPFGTDQIFGIAVAPSGATVYVTHLPNSYDCCFSVCCAVPAGSIPQSAITAVDVASLQPGASLSLNLSTVAAPIVITPDSQIGFVASGKGVYQIGLAQMSLAATIALPAGYAALSTALSGNGNTLAVLCLDTNSNTKGQLSFIDTVTGAISGPVQAGTGGSVSMTPDGNTAYVANGELYVVHVQTLKVAARLPIGNVLATLVSPDGQEIYPLCGFGSSVEALPQGSVTSSKLLRAAGGSWLALSPEGQTLYSTALLGGGGNMNGGMAATSTATGHFVRTMLPGTLVYSVAVSPGGETIYAVTHGTSGASVTVIKASTGTAEKSIPLPFSDYTYGPLAITPAGDRVYVYGGVTAIVIDTRTLSIIASIAGVAGYGLAISPSGDVVYLGTALAGINILQTATNQVIGTIPVTGAISIAFSPDGTRAYALGISSAGKFGICVIDTSTLAVTNFVSSPDSGPIGEALAVTPDGTLLYLGGFPPNPDQGRSATPGSLIETQSLQITGAFPSAGAIVIN